MAGDAARSPEASGSTSANSETAAAAERELDQQLERAVEEALARQFRPEFLNRIDEVIRFRPLAPVDLRRIVRLQLAELAALLREQQLELAVDEEAVGLLADLGYEPEYGARPLRRVLRRRIENPLATHLLEERFLGCGGVRVVVRPAASGEPASLAFEPQRMDGKDVR